MNQSLVSILTLVFILENGKLVETVAGAGHGPPANGVGISDIMAWSYSPDTTKGETAVAVYRPLIDDKYVKNADNDAKAFCKTKKTYNL